MRMFFGTLPHWILALMIFVGGWLHPATTSPVFGSAPAEPQAIETLTPEAVSQIGGTVGAMAVAGHLAYIGIGDYIGVVDFTSPNHPHLIGKSHSLSKAVVDLVLVGPYIYAVTSFGAMYLLDISNPAQPQVLQTFTGLNSSHLLLFEHYLYLEQRSSGTDVIFDITIPSTPVQVATFASPGATDLTAQGAWIYYLLPSGMKIIDFSNPTAPVPVGQLTYAWTPTSIEVRDSLVVVTASPGLFLIDTSTPASPNIMNGTGNPDKYNFYSPTTTTLTSGLLYVATWSGLQVVDIHQPASPTLTKTISMGSWYGYQANHIAIQNDLILVAAGSGGLSVLQATNPASPYWIGSFNQAGITTMAAQNNFLYAVTGYNTLFAIDTSNPAAPIWHSSLALPDQVGEILVSGNILYATGAGYQSNLRLYDISNPDRVLAIGSLKLPNYISTYQIGIKPPYVYLTTSANSLVVVDASNPQALQAQATLELGFAPDGLSISGSYLFLSDRTNQRLVIYSLENGANPVYLGQYTFAAESYLPYLAVTNSHYAYVTTSSGMAVLDIAQPASPNLISTWCEYGCPSVLALVESTLFAGGYGYLYSLDVSDPAAPKAVWEANKPARRLVHSGENLFSLDSNGQILLFREAPSVILTLNTNAAGVLTSPPDQVTYTISANSYPTPVQLTHRRYGREYLPIPQGLAGIGKNFSLDAYSPWNGNNPNPQLPIHLTLQYSDSDTQGIIEDSLTLYRWNGERWDAEKTSLINPATNTISADLSQGGRWAVLGEALPAAYTVFLPIIDKYNGSDIWIQQVELSQEIQRADNSVSMVAGKPTYLRVHVQASENQIMDDASLLISATQGGVELPGSPLTLGPWAIFGAPNRTQLGQAFNLAVPPAWTSGSVQLTFALDPQNTIQEISEDNNTSVINVQFNPKPALKIVLVPINYTYQATNQTYYGPTQDTISHFLLEKFPLSAVEPRLHAPLGFKGDLTTDKGWQDLLSAVTSLRNSEGGSGNALYYGVLPEDSAASYKWGGMGWMGIRASVGLNSSVIVHESGHNFNLPHAPCGGAGGPDPKYPYPGGIIGQWGIDPLVPIIYNPQTNYDIMGYCGGEVFSDYNYQKLFNSYKSSSAAVENAASGKALLVRGIFNPDGSISLQPLYTIPQQSVERPEREDLRVELIGKDGQITTSNPIQILETVDGDVPYREINAMVPLPDKPVTSIRIMDRMNILAEQTLSVSSPSKTEVEAEKNQADTTLRWDGLQEPLLVRFSRDAGISWETLGVDITGGYIQLPEIAQAEGWLVQAWQAGQPSPEPVWSATLAQE